MSDRSHARQLIGSLLAAAVIVAIAIVIVTMRFGPTSAAEQESLRSARSSGSTRRRSAGRTREDAREDAGRRVAPTAG